MDATDAISNSEQDFQIRIPRELDQTFYIPRFSPRLSESVPIIGSNNYKNRMNKKVIAILNHGIQPKNDLLS